MEAIGLGRWNETVAQWHQNTSQDLDCPLTPREDRVDHFDYLDQFEPWDAADLRSLERASGKRQREDDKAFLNKWGIPSQISEAIMSGASSSVDANMNAAMDTNKENKRPRNGGDIQKQREEMMKTATTGFERFVMDHFFKAEDSKEEILQTIQNTNNHIKAVESTLQKHDDRANKMEERMNKFEEALRQVHNGSGAGSDVSRTTAGGGIGVGGPPGLSPSSRFQDFKPTYIELKGWVTNWSDHGARAEQLLTWSDCQKLIDNCLERCNQLEKDAVDRETTELINSGRYMFG